MATRTRIPPIGERGRTFGGEFEVVAKEHGSVLIRWTDDGSTAAFDAAVFQLVLESYRRAAAAEDDDDAGLSSPFAASALFGTLQDAAEGQHCSNCCASFDAKLSCTTCGSLECPICELCECMLVLEADSSGRVAGAM